MTLSAQLRSSCTIEHNIYYHSNKTNYNYYFFILHCYGLSCAIMLVFTADSSRRLRAYSCLLRMDGRRSERDASCGGYDMAPNSSVRWSFVAVRTIGYAQPVIRPCNSRRGAVLPPLRRWFFAGDELLLGRQSQGKGVTDPYRATIGDSRVPLPRLLQDTYRLRAGAIA